MEDQSVSSMGICVDENLRVFPAGKREFAGIPISMLPPWTLLGVRGGGICVGFGPEDV